MSINAKTYYFTASIIRGYSCMGGSCWDDVNFEVSLSDDQVAAIREFYKDYESDCDYRDLQTAHDEIFDIFDNALRDVFDIEVGSHIGFDAEFCFPSLFLADGQRDTDYTTFVAETGEEETFDSDNNFDGVEY